MHKTPERRDLPNHWQAAANKLHKTISNSHFNLVIGLECEFYISHDIPDADCDAIIAACNQSLQIPLVVEDGHRQFEYHIPPHSDLDAFVVSHQQAQCAVELAAGKHAIFASKPYADQPTCGMHIHIHVENGDGQRLYHKHDEEMSAELRHSIAGLIDNLEEAAALLIDEGNAKRFASLEDHLASTISWGNNNRSCAIRLPDSKPDQKRIEYRIAANDAPLEKLLAIIFASILDGMERAPELPSAIYGNASDAQYKLEKLPKNMAEAEQVLARNFMLRHRLT